MFSGPFGTSKKLPKSVFLGPLSKYISESEFQKNFEGFWEALKEVFRAEIVKRTIQDSIGIWTILHLGLDGIFERCMFVKYRNLQRGLNVFIVNVSLASEQEAV